MMPDRCSFLMSFLARLKPIPRTAHRRSGHKSMNALEIGNPILDPAGSAHGLPSHSCRRVEPGARSQRQDTDERRCQPLEREETTVIEGDGLEVGRVLERLEQLEKANRSLSLSLRRLRLGGVGAALMLSVLLLAGAAAVTPCLEARNFVLRDEAGKMRAALAIRPDGTPGLGFLDESGRVRLSMDLGPMGPAVNLMNGIGQPQATLAVRPDGLPGLAIFDLTGQARLSLDVTEGGAPSLHLYGKQGQLRA